jgi:hypothetical protein
MMGDAALQARAISSPFPRIAAHSRIVMLGAGRTVHPNRRKRILRDCTLQWETADASASILAASREPSSRFRRKIWRKDARRLSAWRKGLLRSCTSSAGQNGRPRGLSRCRSRKPTDPPALHASPGELRLPLTYSLVSVSPGGGERLLPRCSIGRGSRSSRREITGCERPRRSGGHSLAGHVADTVAERTGSPPRVVPYSPPSFEGSRLGTGPRPSSAGRRCLSARRSAGGTRATAVSSPPPLGYPPSPGTRDNVAAGVLHDVLPTGAVGVADNDF